jgi:hypothetical protein
VDEETRNDGKLEDGMKTTKQSTARHGEEGRGDDAANTQWNEDQSPAEQRRPEQTRPGGNRDSQGMVTATQSGRQLANGDMAPAEGKITTPKGTSGSPSGTRATGLCQTKAKASQKPSEAKRARVRLVEIRRLGATKEPKRRRKKK